MNLNTIEKLTFCYILTDSATVPVTSGSVLYSGRYHLSTDSNRYCDWLIVTGVHLYRVIIVNGIDW